MESLGGRTQRVGFDLIHRAKEIDNLANRLRQKSVVHLNTVTNTSHLSQRLGVTTKYHLQRCHFP